MDQFFSFIESHSLYPDLSSSLDWLFDESKFDNSHWSSMRKGLLSSSIRDKLFPKPNSFQIKSTQDIESHPSENTQTVPPFALFTGKVLCVDLIRHIRNGIAHGHSTCYTENNTHYMKLQDFHNAKLTAYIEIPILDITALHKLYVEISNQ